jgi:hypothetical protein
MSLGWPIAHQLHTKFDEERHTSRKVVDNDADVIHPLKCHATSLGTARAARWKWCRCPGA